MNNDRQSRIRFKDASAVQKTFEFTFDEGFKWSEGGVEVTFLTDRGELPTVPEPVLGDEKPIKLSFSSKVKTLTSNAAAASGDFVLAQNGLGYVGASWTSTVSGGTFSILCVDVEYFDGTFTHLFEDCRVMGSYQETREGHVIEFAGVCPHPYPTIS